MIQEQESPMWLKEEGVFDWDKKRLAALFILKRMSRSRKFKEVARDAGDRIIN